MKLYRIRYINEADGLTYQFYMRQADLGLYRSLKNQARKIWYQAWDVKNQKWINCA